MRMTRRRFGSLAGLTAAGSAAGLGTACRLQGGIAQRNEWSDRTEIRVPSICQLCPGGCGLSVRVVDRIPVKVEGNPIHPVNRGRLCPRGLAALQSFYDPDRLVAPARRVGDPGSGQWETISWDEALETVGARLNSLRESGNPQALAIMGGDYRGATHRLWDRFATAFGTPNYLRLRTLSPEDPSLVAATMLGQRTPLAYHLAEASFVISFGCSWLEGWHSPVHQMRAFGEMRARNAGGRAEIVHVEPRMSHSAAKADQWLPIKPGTEGVLALGLAHLILREQLHDQVFLDNNTLGFEQWTGLNGKSYPGYKEMVLAEFAPVRVSEITGLRPETIVSVARKFALMRPSIALDDNRSALEGHDLPTRLAIHSLNALVGNVGAVGGVLTEQKAAPLAAWPAVDLDQTADHGRATERLDGAGRNERFLDRDVPRGLAEAILEGESSPVEVLVLHRANPLFGRADKKLFREALERVPMVVSVASVADETCQYADLILPEHHFLERWQDDEVSFLAGFTAVSVGRPAIDPLYDTRHAGDIVFNLAARVGGSVAAAFPWASYEDCIKESCKGLFESGSGWVVSKESEEMLRKVLQRQGYMVPEFSTYGDFWKALTSRGVWWERIEPYQRTLHAFATPSGKLELFPQLINQRLETAALESAQNDTAADERRRLLAALGVAPDAELALYPHLLLDRAHGEEQDDTYPFVLQTYELLTLGGGVGANMPWLQESPAVHVDGAWDSWLEIHPEAARGLGVDDGDLVTVESTAGAITVRARLFAGTRPDVVAIPVGQGHTSTGRWARGRGVDPSDLLTTVKEPGEGLGIGAETRVRIRLA